MPLEPIPRWAMVKCVLKLVEGWGCTSTGRRWKRDPARQAKGVLSTVGGTGWWEVDDGETHACTAPERGSECVLRMDNGVGQPRVVAPEHPSTTARFGKRRL